MPTVIVNFPKATPGCQCATCKEIREAERSAKFGSLQWPRKVGS